MRIGAHTGRILGGVVGTDVVRYDIYGEDVTIANLMESSGTVIKYFTIGRKNVG
jgi:class 3 adenylate cyclase